MIQGQGQTEDAAAAQEQALLSELLSAARDALRARDHATACQLVSAYLNMRLAPR